jgi:hypothetical protein
MSQVDSTGKDHTLLDTFDDLIGNNKIEEGRSVG